MTQWSYEGLVYSLQEGLTMGKLKSGDYDRTLDTTRLADWMEREGVGVAIQGNGQYVHRFRTIKSAPYLYYHKGNHDLLHKPLLAIVGPRKMTSYAREVLEQLFVELKAYDVVTISGMAEGVDQLCHELSIQHNIPTIAVLGAGIGHISKSRRRTIMDSITDAGGLVISEFPLGFKATHYSYPQRNRLVAGLSQAVFLPEAREGSGSLITVDFANVMNVPVYGAPQSLGAEASRGLLLEMQKGRVTPVIHFGDRLESVYSDHRHSETKHTPTPVVDLTPMQVSIYIAIVEQGPQSVDQLAARLEMSAAVLLSELTMMEIDGVVQQSEGGVWRV